MIFILGEVWTLFPKRETVPRLVRPYLHMVTKSPPRGADSICKESSQKKDRVFEYSEDPRFDVPESLDFSTKGASSAVAKNEQLLAASLEVLRNFSEIWSLNKGKSPWKCPQKSLYGLFARTLVALRGPF